MTDEEKIASLVVTSDSREFLELVVSGQIHPTNAQLDAAKALIPYQHQRVGEGSKREQDEQRSKTAHKGTDWDGLLQ